MKLLQTLIFSTFLVLLVLLADNKVFAYSNTLLQTLPQQTDTVKRDTTKKVMKKSSLDSKLEYYAKDSVVVDRKNEIQYLYGGARVKYEGLELDADFIRFDNKTKMIFARGSTNDKGKYFGRPIFKTDEQGSSMADSLTYNIEAGYGIVHGVFTEQEGGFFSGGKTKMQPDNEFHVAGTTYSTCNLPHPHFGIHITKGIATEKHIITGPVYMKFEDIPMPLGLPFAFFPKPNKKASGFILPTPGEDATKGFSLLGGGYYMAFNDYMDARLVTNIYTNGSYDLNLVSNYTKRYKYNGNVNLTYSSTRNGLEGTPEYEPVKTIMIGWSHSQGANARPGTTFSASVNAGSSRHNAVTAGNGTYDPNRFLQNSMSSSISYGKVFGPNSMFNFTSALRHSQETQSRTISLTLPDIALNMSTISPFNLNKRAGEEKWYQKLTVGYSMTASNSVSTTEDLLFAKGGFDRFTNSVNHNIPISLPFTLLKYFNFSSSVNYSEKWDFKTVHNRYIRTTSGYEVRPDTINGFKRGGQYSLSTGMSTKIYGIKQFRGNGAIRAIRHVMTPNVSFSYTPDFSKESYGYYEKAMYYTDDIRPGMSVPTGEYVYDTYGNPLLYSVFINGGPSRGRNGSIGFSLDNNVELKVRNKKDTTGTGERKLAIIQGLTFSSSYNFFALQKKLAPINFSGRSQFTEKLGINFSGQFSPYIVENVPYTTGTVGNLITTYSYQEVDKYVWNNGKLPRLTGFNFSFDYSLNPEAFKKRNENIDKLNNENNAPATRTQEQIDALNAISRDPNAFVDFNIPWNFSFSYSFNYSNMLGRPESKNITNTLNFNGDFNLTPKWKIQYTSGYDFKAKNLSQTSFSIYRDLHCWDLSASWVPFGAYQSYSIDIKVKASVLQDLKLSKRKGFYTRY